MAVNETREQSGQRFGEFGQHHACLLEQSALGHGQFVLATFTQAGDLGEHVRRGPREPGGISHRQSWQPSAFEFEVERAEGLTESGKRFRVTVARERHEALERASIERVMLEDGQGGKFTHVLILCLGRAEER